MRCGRPALSPSCRLTALLSSDAHLQPRLSRQSPGSAPSRARHGHRTVADVVDAWILGWGPRMWPRNVAGHCGPWRRRCPPINAAPPRPQRRSGASARDTSPSRTRRAASRRCLAAMRCLLRPGGYGAALATALAPPSSWPRPSGGQLCPGLPRARLRGACTGGWLRVQPRSTAPAWLGRRRVTGCIGPPRRHRVKQSRGTPFRSWPA